MITCRTLGPPEVSIDGEPAPTRLTWRKHLALLVYLARSTRQRRSREHLIALLWQDKPESAARHSLNEAIRIIRRSAGDDALVSEASQVRLVPGTVRLDVDELQERSAARDWSAAALLAAGDFLEGFSIPESSEFEDWVQSERHLWRRASVQALLGHGEELLEKGQLDAAAALAERACHLDPRSESAVIFAMKGLAYGGDRAAALELYDEFVVRMKDEIGSEPGVELRHLAQRLREDRVRQPPAPGRRSGQRESRPAPLIGREQELSDLVGTWRRTRSGGGASLALIQGDPGMGKSRLAEELTLRAALDGASVATARAVELDLGENLGGLRAIARGGLLRFPGVAGAPAAALAAIAHEVTEWREQFPGAAGEPTMSLVQGLAEVLRVSCDEQPVLVHLDDAQWMDRESLLGVDALLRDLKASRFMLLLSAALQPPRLELDDLSAGLGRDARGIIVRLEPLQEGDLHNLARWWLPRFGADEIERVSRRVLADSAGLPLLAIELFRAVASGLDIQRLAAWPKPYHTLDQTLPSDLPASVVAAIRVGYRRLSTDAQQVLAAASVLEEPVEPARLVTATGLDLAKVNVAFDELEWNRWLVADARGYVFVARIVRSTIARDMLTEGQRRRILGRD